LKFAGTQGAVISNWGPRIWAGSLVHWKQEKLLLIIIIIIIIIIITIDVQKLQEGPLLFHTCHELVLLQILFCSASTCKIKLYRCFFILPSLKLYIYNTRWWFQIFFMFTLFGEDEPILTHIFQMGWFNHQLGYV